MDVSYAIKKAEHQRIDAFDCYFGEGPWESLRLQGDPLDCKDSLGLQGDQISQS